MLPTNMDFVSLHDDAEGLRITVENDAGKRWVVVFTMVRAYRNADEGLQLKTLGAQHVLAGIYEVEHGDLAEWLHGESGYTREQDVRTWAVVTINDWIEVVAHGEPSISEIA